MSVRDILVHVKANEEWSTHIEYAIGAAHHFKARLHAFLTFSDISILRALAGKNEKAVIEQEHRDAECAAKLHEKLKEAAKLKKVEIAFHQGEGPAAELLSWASRFHDLTIVEQRDPRRDEVGYDAAEESALSSGRPILIVPRNGRFEPKARHIIVAWNGSQQSASALHGALPFIDQAEKITICAGEERDRLRGNLRYPPFDIKTYLARRVKEVNVEEVLVSSDEVGEHLLSRANELSADMLVMGAYGRSWFREALLGGATRYIFRNLTVPVLTGR
jgi:nucleotide-binding universal stress UspA family protein